MSDNVFVVSSAEYGSDIDFWRNNSVMQDTFATYDEYHEFWQTLAQTYPEGTPEEYVWQKLEQYRYFKMLEALEELEQMNLVIRNQNEDGEDVWRIVPGANRAA